MIVVDVETGGLDPQNNPLLSIGAVDYDNSDREYYGKIAPYLDLEITKEALGVNGINVEEWKENNLLKETIQEFSDWVGVNKKNIILAGHNPRFDLDFLKVNFKRVDISFPFTYRTVDLHTLAYSKFGGKEKLTSDRIYELLGMEIEPRPHNALTGAKYETKAFSLLKI
ncbi:hypothetical protein LCGC14_1560170 [marine sediment metagenome]|uniref:Exonuclease domain-containing protein n=1 Tax=marine sediment metagenome TaxID=412755 RepID=A0A0F9IMQ7_9ZZZZ